MRDARLRAAAGVAVGDAVDAQRTAVDRERLVRYAGASLDFNPIHWSDAAAASSGLPDVIAHGMLTMALAGRAATAWAGDPTAVRSISVRFAAPVPVPAVGTATVDVAGRVAAVADDGTVELELEVRSGDREVLKRARAELRLRV